MESTLTPFTSTPVPISASDDDDAKFTADTDSSMQPLPVEPSSSKGSLTSAMARFQ